MPSNYSGTATAHTSIPIPDDGDRVSNANVAPPWQKLMDLAVYLRPTVNRAPFRPDTWKRDAPVNSSYTPSFSAAGDLEFFDGDDQPGTGRYKLNIGGVVFTEVNDGSTAGYAYFMRLGRDLLTNGRTLTTATLKIAPDTGHASLPQMMPSMLISRYSPGGTEHLTTGLVADASADVTAYHVQGHTLTYTATQNNVIDHASYIYFLTFVAEGGTNASADLGVYELICTHT